MPCICSLHGSSKMTASMSKCSAWILASFIARALSNRKQLFTVCDGMNNTSSFRLTNETKKKLKAESISAGAESEMLDIGWILTFKRLNVSLQYWARFQEVSTCSTLPDSWKNRVIAVYIGRHSKKLIIKMVQTHWSHSCFYLAFICKIKNPQYLRYKKTTPEVNVF